MIFFTFVHCVHLVLWWHGNRGLQMQRFCSWTHCLKQLPDKAGHSLRTEDVLWWGVLVVALHVSERQAAMMPDTRYVRFAGVQLLLLLPVWAKILPAGISRKRCKF
jgi:hypothetical protein